MDIVTFIPPHLRKKAMIACQNEDLPVLMSGEDGTGKSAIARWIHRHRSRSIQPLHLYDPKKDLISQILNAHQASLVFSEITKLSQSDQKKISKFLQSGSIKDPQSNLPKIVSVHLYFLTQHKINDQSCDPFFYPSLFKQIKSQMIEIPSLIHRKQEFKDICMGLLSEMTHELKKDFIKGFEKKALDRLLEYHWPGNIRELRNILKLTITESQSDYIKVEELPDFKSENLDYLKTRTDFEKSYLQEIFNKNDKNIDKMAVFLNMERKALLKKIEKLNLKLIEKNLSS